MASVIAGISGAHHNASVAICVDGEIRAVCEQERITRVRRAGLVPGQLPEEALQAALQSAGNLTLGAISSFVTAEPAIVIPGGLPVTRVDHHEAHAAAAFYLSPFDEAAILICDRYGAGNESVWTGRPGQLSRLDWPDSSPGFASIYTTAAEVFGLARGREHELEGFARLDTGADRGRLADVIGYRDGALWVAPDWKEVLRKWLGERQSDGPHQQAAAASAFQAHLGEQLIHLVREVRARTGASRLCLGGGLFFNTYFTTVIQRAAIFDEVSVAPNPGNAGLAVGAALMIGTGGAGPRVPVSPFLGPEYNPEAIKQTLDNCKLSYEHTNERELIEVTVRALARGQLVGWFQGRMEWGHRALGNRSIFASPLSSFVLENLNVFLKHRDRHRAYAVSVPVEHASRYFDGPPSSRYMEYEVLAHGSRAVPGHHAGRHARHPRPDAARTRRTRRIGSHARVAPAIRPSDRGPGPRQHIVQRTARADGLQSSRCDSRLLWFGSRPARARPVRHPQVAIIRNYY